MRLLGWRRERKKRNKLADGSSGWQVVRFIRRIFLLLTISSCLCTCQALLVGGRGDNSRRLLNFPQKRKMQVEQLRNLHEAGGSGAKSLRRRATLEKTFSTAAAAAPPRQTSFPPEMEKCPNLFSFCLTRFLIRSGGGGSLLRASPSSKSQVLRFHSPT